ncbi:MAG: cytochrome c biogenesis protein CcsA [Selenomonadaceae bacterium]|nr:cytochrome c biogenesis protein CcsA [Selenomonadaceae bacterium]
MTGNILLALTLASSMAVTMLSSILKMPSDKYIRWSAIVSAAATVLASLHLWQLIFADDFSIAYVMSYSSRELPTVYKISAFWAGQQGSFLLWLLFHATAGLLLSRSLDRPIDRSTLAVYYFLQSMLTVLVLIKSPFELSDATPYDGVGLNPLLQDFWMAIHPPIIFLGYSLLAVPISMSVGTLLIDPKSTSWLEPARRWTLIAWSMLGAGIFVGGYWAYKVLGWGGYWGWDPVENSSLVPWLLSAVLLHLINLSKARPPVLVAAHAAAICTYSLVIYGTFLTRSGLLGDFSVHSFAGTSIGLTIAVVNAIVLIGGLAILTLKAKALPEGQMYRSFGERAFMILLGMLVMVFVAVPVWIGMSMPLLSQLVGAPAAVDTSFYVRTTSPLGAAIAALIIATFIKYKFKSMSLGGVITHVAVLTGLLSIVLSSSGGAETKELMPNVETELLGHAIVYEGQRFTKGGDEKFYVYSVDGREVRALTKLRSNGEDAAREPAILRTMSGDVYLAPTPYELEVEEMIINRKRMAMGADFSFIFRDSTVEYDVLGMPKVVRAELTVTDGDRVETIEPTINVTRDGGTSDPVDVFDGRKRIRLTGISDDEQRIRIEILPSVEAIESAPVITNVSTKPLIWLLWLSAAAISVGTLAAVKRR